MTQKKVRVGFDLDGVILYNPARLSRPVFAFFRESFLKRKKAKFHIPHTPLSKLLWYFFHQSSLFVAPGYNQLLELIKEGKVEAYIISGRYESLSRDFQKWATRLQADKYFTGVTHNKGDQQPYEFKKQMIKKLDLDFYVEDNWDILEVLRKEPFAEKTKLLWLSNPLDWHKNYPYKFRNFASAINYIKKSLDS